MQKREMETVTHTNVKVAHEDRKLTIHHDLLIQEILSRLSVQTLFRFNCVSKAWCSLRYDATFVQSHLNRVLNADMKTLVLTNTYQGSFSILSFYSIDNWNNPKLLFKVSVDKGYYLMRPSCHGLVCLSCIKGQKIYVSNPSTHEVIQIPDPKLSLGDIGVDAPFIVTGFGFDQTSGKYKVSCGFCSEHTKSRKHFVFTLVSADGRWKEVDDLPCQIQHMLESAYLNGEVHWITRSLRQILTFNFENEKYKLLPVPNYTYSGPLSGILSLKVAQGHLHLVTLTPRMLEFWTLNDYMNKTWSYECKVSLKQIENPPAGSPSLFPFLISYEKRKVLVKRGRLLYVYDLESNNSQQVDCPLAGIYNDHPQPRYQPNHVESLVSVINNNC